MKRRTILTGVGLGIGGVCAFGAANFYHSLLNFRRRKPLIIGGATVVKRLLDLQLIEAFIKHHPEADLLIEGGYSFGGLIALERGAIDLAMMSNDFSSATRTNFLEYLIGLETVALIVNENSVIKDISTTNARKVFRREITNWKELGGPDSPIRVYSRLDDSNTKRTIEQILLEGGLIHESAKMLSSSKAMAQQVSADPLALGFISQQGYFRTKNPAIRIRSLSIDGIEMDQRSVGLALYPLVRQLFLVVRTDASEISKKFVTFVLSDEGQRLLADSGAQRVS
ncbi:MAG: substrate-binding domain-containing protein [Alcaligenaceae bacterium]